jgi:hypothetical protein
MLGLTVRTTCDPGPHLGEWEDASRYYRSADEPKATVPFSGLWVVEGHWTGVSSLFLGILGFPRRITSVYNNSFLLLFP